MLPPVARRSQERCLELDFSEALAMIRDGRIADAKTIVLLQWAALEGPFAGDTVPECPA
jgi:hypothetical protein